MAEPAYDFQQDSGPPWPRQGLWTWNDYLRLPDDGQRYEIIHGVLYVSPAPRLIHQFAATRLAHFLTAFVLERDLGVVMTAPIDVLLPRDIAGKAKRLDARLLHFAGRPLDVAGLEPHDRQLAPGPAKPVGNHAAQSAGAAGNQNHLVAPITHGHQHSERKGRGGGVGLRVEG